MLTLLIVIGGHEQIWIKPVKSLQECSAQAVVLLHNIQSRTKPFPFTITCEEF